MRFSSAFWALAPATVLASPLSTTTSPTASKPTGAAAITSVKSSAVSVVSSVVSLFTGTCSTVAPAVLALQGWGTPASSFCTSWVPITTETAPVVTVTAPTSTITASTSTIVVTAPDVTTTLDQQTITADTSTSYTTVYTGTVTVTGAANCNLNQKRAAPSSTPAVVTTRTLPSDCPVALRAFASSYISSACQCLHLPTPTFTPTTTTTPLTTSTPLTSTTTTPISTITPVPATVTPSTTVTVSTASTVTVPGVILPNATPVTSVDGNGIATSNYDDGYFNVALPFAISLYGQSTSNIVMGINGWISVSGDGSSRYVNTQLPASGFVDDAFIAYWSDLFVYQGTQQGLYYSVYGDAPNRRVGFEWYTSTYGDASGYYHFIATLQEEAPGRVTYDYYEITPRPGSTNGGVLGTVGVQRNSQGQSAQYSYNNAAPISPGLRVVYNPNSNSFSSSTRTSCEV